MSTPPRRPPTRRAGWLLLAAGLVAGGWLLQDRFLGGRADAPGPGGRPSSAAGRPDPTAFRGAGEAGSRDSPSSPAAGPRASGRALGDGEPVGPVPGPAAGPEEGGTPPTVEENAPTDPRTGSGADAASRSSAESGDGPLTRVRRLFGEGETGEVRLDSADLAVLAGPRRPWRLPDGVSDPRFVPRDSLLEASADVDVGRVLGERMPLLLRRMMGDSARVTAHLSPRVPAPGVLRLGVRDVRAGSVTFPRSLLPWVLSQLGLPTAADDPAAVELTVGRGLSGARVEEGALVLARDSAP